MISVACPECDTDIDIPDDSDLEDVITCDECGSDFEIVGVDPIEISVVEYEDEFVDEDEEI